MNITKEDAINKAVDNINDAKQRIREGDFGAARVHFNAASMFIDVLQRIEAGASNMRVESITFGDGKAPAEITIPKRGEGE